MHNRSNGSWMGWVGVLAVAASVSVSSPAGAVICNGGFGTFTCAQGTSVASVFGFLSRPREGNAFFHMEIDMTGGEIGAIAQAVDEAGNMVRASAVVDKDPGAGVFLGAPASDLFGPDAGDEIIDEQEDFQHPLDLVGIQVIVI